MNDAAQGVVEDVPQDVAQDLAFGARAARAHHRRRPVFVQFALRWGRNWAAQWHLARAVGKRFRGCRAKRLYVYYISMYLLGFFIRTKKYRCKKRPKSALRVKKRMNIAREGLILKSSGLTRPFNLFKNMLLLKPPHLIRSEKLTPDIEVPVRPPRTGANAASGVRGLGVSSFPLSRRGHLGNSTQNTEHSTQHKNGRYRPIRKPVAKARDDQQGHFFTQP